MTAVLRLAFILSFIFSFDSYSQARSGFVLQPRFEYLFFTDSYTPNSPAFGISARYKVEESQEHPLKRARLRSRYIPNFLNVAQSKQGRFDILLSYDTVGSDTLPGGAHLQFSSGIGYSSFTIAGDNNTSFLYVRPIEFVVSNLLPDNSPAINNRVIASVHLHLLSYHFPFSSSSNPFDISTLRESGIEVLLGFFIPPLDGFLSIGYRYQLLAQGATPLVYSGLYFSIHGPVFMLDIPLY